MGYSPLPAGFFKEDVSCNALIQLWLRRSVPRPDRYAAFSEFLYYIQQKFDSLLYWILKPIVRLAMLIFCRKVTINKPELLHSKGPLLLACNHPNSFLDSVILDTLFKRPIWSLARGDVFKKRFIIRLLTAMKILPVYRTSEGVENLSENYKTFDACIQLFKEDKIVMIFSEGKCINEWHLRPLKKGTARLAIKAWEENIPLKIIPVGINYSSFHRFGKNLFINFGNPILKEDFNLNEPDGIRYQSFNNKLKEQLEQLVYEIQKTDKPKQTRLLTIKQSAIKKLILSIPAAIGFIIHAPLFLPVKKFTWKRTAHNDHYDSVMTGILLFAYPFYVLLIVSAILIICKSPWFLFLFIVFPFTAWSYVQLKPQLDK